MGFTTMHARTSTGWLMPAALLVLGACAGKEEVVEAGIILPIEDGGLPAAPMTVCTPDNVFCNPPPAMQVDGGAGCGNAEIDLEPVGVNVMIAVDGSAAMANHWETLQLAIKKMLESNASLNFGAHLFWADVSSIDMLLDKLNFCGTTQNRVLDVAAAQQTAILPFLGAVPPGPGGQWFSFRPTVEPLNYYLANASALSSPNTTNYLVFISNGDDNCFGTAFAQDADKLITYEKIGIELVKRNIRVLPIGFDGATAQRTWNGMLKTDFQALDRLAKFGGTGLTRAYAAESAEQLTEAISAISQTVRSCRFSIPDSLDPSKTTNPFALEFLVNGVAVPRDRSHKSGWDFVNGNTTQAEAFGEPCTAIRSGKPLKARARCSSDGVCGTAAAKLSTKPRAIQFLLDASASMLICSNVDLLQCLPAPFGSDALTWWEVAVRSIATTVVSTVNDDAEFGLMYLPGRASGLGSCEASPEPEVAPRDGSEIAVIQSALTTLPFGSTPLVAALETTAGKPGRIGEANVSGALVVISDGGNSCGGMSAEEAVARLGAAAMKLNASGTKIFVIKVGNSSTAEEDAQLRSIAVNGGAPQDSTAGTPYLTAPTPEKLSEVLAGLSDTLASCQLDLGPAPKGADITKTNLYIDGEVIRFDSQASKQDGWGWADDKRETMVMFGKACTQFKQSRAANIVVEFGCASIVLE
jgi:hypothetical protein